MPQTGMPTTYYEVYLNLSSSLVPLFLISSGGGVQYSVCAQPQRRVPGLLPSLCQLHEEDIHCPTAGTIVMFLLMV